MGHSSAGHSKPARREDELTVLKLRKLRQQKDLADDFNSILTRQGGLNDQAHLTCKNLEYAIAIATRPGAIEYYKPPEETVRIVENGELAALIAKIGRLQRELDQIEQDIEQAGTVSSEASARAAASGPSFASLKDWFAAYGDPKPPSASGYLTYFEDSPKIYGGTNHHRGGDRSSGICPVTLSYESLRKECVTLSQWEISLYFMNHERILPCIYKCIIVARLPETCRQRASIEHILRRYQKQHLLLVNSGTAPRE